MGFTTITTLLMLLFLSYAASVIQPSATHTRKGVACDINRPCQWYGPQYGCYTDFATLTFDLCCRSTCTWNFFLGKNTCLTNVLLQSLCYE
ncbi:hypothetical protein V1264_024820 [Littorina saxatilis]|uniref:Uncharacterized protein n=1 Tax=Littorina saxatilis TaxID=31220 RepID=A0AAN9AMK4_9CAEN